MKRVNLIWTCHGELPPGEQEMVRRAGGRLKASKRNSRLFVEVFYTTRRANREAARSYGQHHTSRGGDDVKLFEIATAGADF